MKKYKEEAYKGYLKFVKENRYQKIATIAWVNPAFLRVKLEAPLMLSNKSKGEPRYFFCPKTHCLISFEDEKNRNYAKELVYSTLWRMSKELDEIDEKVEGRQ